MANWTFPALSQLWVDFLAAIKDRDVSLAKLDFGTDTNIPDGSIRFNQSMNRFELWSTAGSTWTALNLNLVNVTGILPAANFNDTAHGNRAGGTLHAVATGALAGFLPAADKTKLDEATAAATATTLMLRDAAARSKVAAPAAADDIARKDTVDIHAAIETAPVHGSTVAATVNKLVHRDAAGRAQMVAPSVAADIAIKSTVDTVQTNLDSHAATQGEPIHGSASAATASKLMHRDAAGRSKVAAPSAADDVARKDTVDSHANTTTAGVHGSAVAATVNTLIHRDAAGRAQIVSPSVAADISNKGYVDTQISASAYVGTAQLKTATGSASSACSVALNVTMNDYSFSPALWHTTVPFEAGIVTLSTDPGTTVGQFRILANMCGTELHGARWRYVTASDEPTIWIAYHPVTGKIVGVWCSDDPTVNDEPGVWVPGMISKKLKASDLAGFSGLSTKHAEADIGMAAKGQKVEHRNYRALQLLASDDAPSVWLLGWMKYSVVSGQVSRKTQAEYDLDKLGQA